MEISDKMYRENAEALSLYIDHEGPLLFTFTDDILGQYLAAYGVHTVGARDAIKAFSGLPDDTEFPFMHRNAKICYSGGIESVGPFIKEHLKEIWPSTYTLWFEPEGQQCYNI